jgi:hypothetical protein
MRLAVFFGADMAGTLCNHDIKVYHESLTGDYNENRIREKMLFAPFTFYFPPRPRFGNRRRNRCRENRERMGGY